MEDSITTSRNHKRNTFINIPIFPILEQQEKKRKISLLIPLPRVQERDFHNYYCLCTPKPFHRRLITQQLCMEKTTQNQLPCRDFSFFPLKRGMSRELWRGQWLKLLQFPPSPSSLLQVELGLTGSSLLFKLKQFFFLLELESVQNEQEKKGEQRGKFKKLCE